MKRLTLKFIRKPQALWSLGACQYDLDVMLEGQATNFNRTWSGPGMVLGHGAGCSAFCWFRAVSWNTPVRKGAMLPRSLWMELNCLYTTVRRRKKLQPQVH